MHNVNSMMYTGEKPWHGLGKKLENVATSAEAIIAAGLNWGVKKSPLFLENGKPVNGAFATVREDTGDVLGTVGGVYTVLQNKDAFRFFDGIVGTQEAMYHTAGALGLGECVWMLAKLPGYIRTVGDDVTEKYLLLTNRHDGSGAVNVLFTPIRVVCQNTLNVAISGAENTAKIRHTMAMGGKINDVRKKLGILNNQFTMFEDLSRKMTGIQMTGQTLKEFVKASGLIPEADKDGNHSTRAQNIMDEVSAMFERGRGNNMPGVKGTAWAAFNAVTEYVDYARATRGAEGESRAKSLLFGSGANIKQAAWDKAVSLL